MKEESMFKKKAVKGNIWLGDQVADKITGFTGIVVAEYLSKHNMPRFAVKSQVLRNGVPVEPQWFDECVLELKKKGAVEPVPMVPYRFRFDDEVRDTETGFQGIVTGIAIYINGCVKIAVQDIELKDGRPSESIDFPTQQLEFVKKANAEPEEEPVYTGGPMDRKFKSGVPSLSNRR
jgi:hypothetical protein